MSKNNDIPKKKGRMPPGKVVFLVAICLVVILAIGAVYFLVFRSGTGQQTLLSREIVKLEQMVEKSPNLLDARVRLAILYHADGQDKKALEQLDNALQQNKNYQSALIARGDIFVDNGRYQEALVPYAQVVDLNKNNPMRGISRELEGVYYKMAVAQLGLKKADQAVASLKEALGIDSTDADAWNLMGNSYLSLKDWPNAIESFSIAVQFVPEFQTAYEGLASAYKETKQDNLANYAKAMVNFSAGKNSEAIKGLEQVIALAPDFAEAHQGLGLAYEKNGQTDKAIAAYREAKRLKPDLWLADAKLQALGGK